MKQFDVWIQVGEKEYRTTVKAFNKQGAEQIAKEALMKKLFKVTYSAENMEDIFKIFGGIFK